MKHLDISLTNKGFSILELLIVMIISTTIISSSFYIYDNILKYRAKQQIFYEKTLNLKKIFVDLKHLFVDCRSLTINENTVSFFTISSVEYEFCSDYFLNKSHINDTIFLDLIELKAYYNSIELHKGTIDEIRISATIDDEIIEMAFYKKYPYYQKVLIENKMKD